MSAFILQIADAVVEELNGQEFSQEFTAVRRVLPLFKLKDMDTLHVTVVPKTLGIAVASRGSYQYDYAVDIGVQQHLTDIESETGDLLALVEEIAEFFKGRSLEDLGVVCVAVANEPVYAPDHMQQKSLFTSLLTLTFRAWR